MMRAILSLAVVAGASAFAPSAPLGRVSTRAAVARGPRMQQMSEAIPFMPKPANINDSMPGYSGFDPLGFSDYFDIKYLQEAEIKHGRVCMLAALGMVFPEFGKLPQFASFSTNPLQAFYEVGPGGWAQIFVFIGVLESFSYEKVFYTDKAPGDLGFDPLRMSKDAATAKWYSRAEVMNGRLAMIGFSGMLHHAILTKQGPITQIIEQNFVPSGLGST